MKKFLLTLVAVLCVSGAFAQDWKVGGRIGSGLQAVGQYTLNHDNYVEGRFGMAWLGGMSADFTALYNWHILDMDWTPDAGTWFFDAGVGVNVGGAKGFCYVGPAGMARLGYTFKKAPVSLSADYAPVLGVVLYGKDFVGDYDKKAGFYGMGWGNFGITCTYNF